MKHLLILACFWFVPPGHAAAGTPASFAYVLQADASAKSASTSAENLATCDRDWIVLDTAFSSEEPWSPENLDTIRGGKPERKVIAYLSIGEAEDYRPYWKKAWGTRDKLTSSAPAWLGSENPAWKGNYRVQYWHPEWQKIILAAVDDIMARGFDGIYLDIVDGFETFEQEGADFIDDRMNQETRQTYRRDMIDWVRIIAVRARTKNPTALVIPQNGSQLIAHADFLTTISAIGVEDLFTHGDRVQPLDHMNYVLEYLEKATAAKKPVLAIEYPTKDKFKAHARQLAQANGLVLLITDRQLKTLGEP